MLSFLCYLERIKHDDPNDREQNKHTLFHSQVN